MAVFIETNVIADPDQLGYEVNPASFAAGTEEILIDTTNKLISLKITGNLTNAGATIKAVYSKLKDAWRVDSTLIKFPFPMGPITDEQFEMVNGWNWDKTETSGTDGAALTTVELLRTGGWSVVVAGSIREQWSGIITLGTLGDTDQVYYQLVNADEPSVNFKLTGKVNQAIQVYSDPNGDGNIADGFSKLNYLKIFVREWQKLYAQAAIAEIGVSTLAFQAYRFPLTNSTDLKVTATELEVDANSDGVPDVGVYANVTVTYLRDADGNFYNVIGDWVSGSNYERGDVVGFGTTPKRWYELTAATLSNSTTDPAADTTNWTSYVGEKQIGASYYPYTVIVDADTTLGPTGSGAARTQEIYTAVQYKLRQSIDIDDSAGNVTGKTADSLLRFVGDTLVTSRGVYIESFNSQDTNAITFTDATNFAATFPFVAALTVNFGTNLQDDQYSEYWIFFTSGVGTGTGNDFGTEQAIIVKDADGVDMAGSINPAWPTKRTFVSHTYNYDANNQRSSGTYNSGSGSQGTDAPITAVAIGLTTSQYVIATSTIQKSTANSVTLTSALERNYSQGTTYP